ncbi:hypothetical protein [Streptomyces sp. NRRL S-350]|uniref:hypothetical protein n=1 Tax=Streptomyces sp. NRRL S-350 TaxID=1463902 RepID=UPI0004C0D8F2|nr:hypothetical protein [Streptomyces sp. NRRL S-350]
MSDDFKITNTMCPTEVQGKAADGCPVDLRFRWGLVVVRLSGQVVLGARVSDNTDGLMEPGAALRLARAVATLHTAPAANRAAAAKELDLALAAVRSPLLGCAAVDPDIHAKLFPGRGNA